MTMRVCRACGESKDVTQYALKERRADGYERRHPDCFKCRSDKRRRKEGRMTAAQIRSRKEERAARMLVERFRRISKKAARGTEIRAMEAKLLNEDPGSRTCVGKTLTFRALYRYDDAFRAKQIERQHRKKSAENGHVLMSDGSLDTAAVARLFGAAKDCLYCGASMRSEDKTLDHITPRSKGGWHSIKNAVVCCKWCNARKGRMTPERWLKRVPNERRALIEAMWQRVSNGTISQLWLVA